MSLEKLSTLHYKEMYFNYMQTIIIVSILN